APPAARPSFGRSPTNAVPRTSASVRCAKSPRSPAHPPLPPLSSVVSAITTIVRLRVLRPGPGSGLQLSLLSIDLAQHDIQAGVHRDHVREQLALHHLRQRREVDEAGTAHAPAH